MMKLKDLRCFIAVYETNGFARAAETLNSTQSCVSWRIRRLEEELGGPLFQRLHRSIAPTPKGEVAYRYAKGLIANTEDAVRAIRGEKAA